MFRKNCYKCQRSSFSSEKRGVWICPVCGEDLSDLRAREAHIWEGRHSFQHNERRNIKNSIVSDAFYSILTIKRYNAVMNQEIC